MKRLISSPSEAGSKVEFRRKPSNFKDCNIFSLLPDDLIIFSLFSFLTYSEIAGIQKICKTSLKLASSSQLWENRFNDYFEEERKDVLRFFEEEVNNGNYYKIFSWMYSLCDAFYIATSAKKKIPKTDKDWRGKIKRMKEINKRIKKKAKSDEDVIPKKTDQVQSASLLEKIKNRVEQKRLKYQKIVRLFQRLKKRNVVQEIKHELTSVNIRKTGVLHEKDQPIKKEKVGLFKTTETKEYEIVRGTFKTVMKPPESWLKQISIEFIGNFVDECLFGKGRMIREGATFDGEWIEGGKMGPNFVITSSSIGLIFDGQVDWDKNNFEGIIRDLDSKDILYTGKWEKGVNPKFPHVTFHMNHTCDYCNQGPMIAKTRYCVYNYYDFCEQCFEELNQKGVKLLGMTVNQWRTEIITLGE